MSQNNEVRQALAFVENAVDALSDVSLQAAATTLAAEVRRLRAVSQTINAIWEDVDAYARKHPEISWGDRVSQHALKLMKERDALAAELAKLRAQIADKPAVAVPMGSILQKVMAALAPMLDEDQFATIESIAASGGHEPPAGAVPAVPDDIIPDGDDFNGTTPHMIKCIESLVAMNDRGILVPHGLCGHSRTLLLASANRLRQQAAPAVPEEWRESTKAMLLSLDEAIRAGNAVYVRQEDKVVNHRHCWMRFHEKRQVVEALLQSAPPPPKKR